MRATDAAGDYKAFSAFYKEKAREVVSFDMVLVTAFLSLTQP
jgi:hypothetical protein